jgi:hypothetical protein
VLITRQVLTEVARFAKSGLSRFHSLHLYTSNFPVLIGKPRITFLSEPKLPKYS